jgi:hypothetical protein
MIFGFGKKKRHVVATALVAVDGDAVAPVMARAVTAARAIVDAASGDGDEAFGVASAEVAAVARTLLDHELDWRDASLGGDVYDSEAEAAAGLADVFADLSGRYLAGDGAAEAPGSVAAAASRRCVVMLTVVYAGERDDIERELNDRRDLQSVLTGIVGLHERNALLAAQVHVAPAHPEDRLTDEQLLLCFPELQSV